jgi:hypothetical protein
MAGEPISPPSRDDELEALRRRVADLERELAERTELANAAVAAAQDRSYWLDRWHVDLNALMRRRGASELRAALRAARAVYRLLYDARNAVAAALGQAPSGLARAKRLVEQERELAEGAGGGEHAARRALEAAGVEPRPDDTWVRVQPGSQLDDLPAAGRVILEADGVAPDAVLSRCTPAWRVALYLRGDPDVYLLERR